VRRASFNVTTPFEVFIPKLSRRLTVYRRAVLDTWVVIESDPSVVTFRARPGTIMLGEHHHQDDFSVRYTDRNELLIASDALVNEGVKVSLAIDTSASLNRPGFSGGC
jgi:hypothetical protein